MRLRPLATLALAALFLSACGSEEPATGAEPSAGASATSPQPSPSMSGEPSPTTSPSPVDRTGPEGSALIALCEVASDLGSGEVDRAAAVFEDEVHETLHEIADELGTVDRKVAAALLVAKSKVEAGFADPSIQASAQARAVGALIDEMRAAMSALDIDQPACPT